MTKEVKRKEGQLGRLPKYPWDKWFSRKTSFSLHKGKDFDCDTYGMMVYFRQIARMRRRVVHISIQEDSLFITIERE